MSLRLRRWQRRLLITLALVAVGYGALATSTSRSQPARAVIWGESDGHDYARFPAHRIAAGPTRFRLHRPPGGKASAMTATVANLRCGTVVDGLEPPGCGRGER
jgi:hypothetical protein